MKSQPCAACGQLVQRPTTQIGKHVFCSKECRKTPCIPVVCVVCGNDFLATGYGKPHLYCSNECYRQHCRDEQIHKNGKLVTLQCEQCGKLFGVRSSIARDQKYCSKQCAYIGTAHKHRGENNPKWKPKVLKRCEYCGKEFETFPSRKDKTRYCCKDHASISNALRFMSGKQTSIEKAMADALEKQCLDFLEQVVMYDKFLVDFLLPYHDIIIQCDGIYWHDRPKARARDKGQDRYFAKCGYTVLRFTDKEINTNLNACIEQILNTINQ